MRNFQRVRKLDGADEEVEHPHELHVVDGEPVEPVEDPAFRYWITKTGKKSAGINSRQGLARAALRGGFRFDDWDEIFPSQSHPTNSASRIRTTPLVTRRARCCPPMVVVLHANFLCLTTAPLLFAAKRFVARTRAIRPSDPLSLSKFLTLLRQIMSNGVLIAQRRESSIRHGRNANERYTM